jgi:hypothetical protein
MADITMCKGGSCGLRETCYRYKAKAGDMQSWFAVLPGHMDPDNGWECEKHVPYTKAETRDDLGELGLF